MKELNHWSYSAWSSLQSCAFRFYRKYICGDQEPKGPALERGIEIHKLAENYLKGEIKGVPPALNRFKPHYQQLLKMKPVIEEFWGVDENWKPKEYRSWCVMKMDAALEPHTKAMDGWLLIQDLKTGREYEKSHFNQARLYAAIGYAKYKGKKFKGVETEWWYSDSGEIASYKFTVPRIEREIEFWKQEGKKMLRQKTFLPMPSVDNCKWCFARSDKGGACDAWRKAR